MTFNLTSGPHFIARGSLAAVLRVGVMRGLIACERYPATRTGDDVLRHTLAPGVRISLAPRQREKVAA
jgi:hypothetical protein